MSPPIAPTGTGLPRRAVAATDFSQSSTYAARTVFELLDETGRLTLVHVCADVELPPDALREWRTQYGRIADVLLARTAREIAGHDVNQIDQRQLMGDPVHEIITFARQMGADLISVGSHGYRIAERILVGSVATRLLRAAHYSVLIAPPNATGIVRAAGIAREIAWQAEAAVLPGVL
ncbi:MAG TPA: universal stress protein [Gemmatimonadaceae bacterium]|jgi:nucleotide-binding universal stress UspA family protein|nr:universal stress protein [Gemmatimonadaceae bacterium]